jgi:hypothetical protein
MKTRSSIAKVALGVAASAAALTALIPAVAAAQGPAYDGRAYDPQGGYYYNGCERAQNGRAVGGGLAGAAAGAVIGGNVASRHVRDEGALLGGFLGAIVGSQIGKSTAACDPNQGRAPTTYGYTQAPQPGPYDYPPQYGYAPPPAYDYGYDQRSYGPRRHRGYAYGYGSDSASDYDRAYDRSSDPQDCRMVESRVRLPDGTVKTRMVQACRDSHGEYQLVQ